MRLEELVRRSLDEDVGAGDVTTEATVPKGLQGLGRVRAKAPLVVCGHNEAAEVFAQVGCTYAIDVPEGVEVGAGTIVARATGAMASLLRGERVALNFLMRLSGIATHTRAMTAQAGPLRVTDTRKTTPLHRASERRAVRVGGGINHRFALYDGVLIKDNHIVAAGGITAAVAGARAAAHHLLKVEVEVSTLDGLEEAIAAGADVVMLDNMGDDDVRAAVRVAAGRVLLEVSGNVDGPRLVALRDAGVDLVSVGGLVHQARWADLSMKVQALGPAPVT